MKQCNPKWTVGMDLGDTTHAVCVLDEDGNVEERTVILNCSESILKFFERFENASSVRVAMEAGTHSPWVSDLLLEGGFEVLVANARKLRSIWDADDKTDENDAEQIARIARFDPKLLYPIRHRGPDAQAHLAIIRARDVVVRTRTMLICSARGLVKSIGGRLPKCSAESFSKKACEHVPPELTEAIDPLLSQIAATTTTIRRYDRTIERLCEHVYPETMLLRQIAGVGPVTALAFVLTIENPHRFKKNRSVGPFLGLTPKRDQSGETDKPLSITKAGNGHMRRLLMNAANYILGPFGPKCDLRSFGERISARGGKVAKRRAKTAVARKLAVLMLSLWKSGQDYEPFHRSKGGEVKKNEAA